MGRNLQDHPLVMGVNFRARSRLGLARDNGGGAIMNWRSSRASRPDLHAFVVQGRHAYPEAAARYGLTGDADVFAISPGLLGSRGVGRLTVRDLSAAGPAAVELESGFLTEQADVDALVEALDTVLELAATAAYRSLIAGQAMPPAGCPGRRRRRSSGRTARRCATRAAPPRWAPGRTPWSARTCGCAGSTGSTSPTPR